MKFLSYPLYWLCYGYDGKFNLGKKRKTIRQPEAEFNEVSGPEGSKRRQNGIQDHMPSLSSLPQTMKELFTAQILEYENLQTRPRRSGLTKKHLKQNLLKIINLRYEISFLSSVPGCAVTQKSVLPELNPGCQTQNKIVASISKNHKN